MAVGGAKPLRLLVLSSLYPNSIQPRHGVFVEERLRSLMATGQVAARVIAPVPWFPSRHPRFGRYADFATVPASELRHGLEVLHPRYFVIPRVGMALGPRSMAAAVAPVVRRLFARGEHFDVIDAHYFYPDGVAAALLGHKFRKPVVITARGTDINTIARLRVPGQQIVRAAGNSAAIVTVSGALKQALVDLGVAEKHITTLRNGVDLERFAPIDQNTARAEINCDLANTTHVWLAVGHLVDSKGVHIAIEALAKVADVTLLVAGTGPEEGRLRNLAACRGVAERVRFLGHVEHDDLPRYFSAADALIFPTAAEGMPNVVLESMACGTAVLATAVGGIPEVVEEPTAGVLMYERTPEAVVTAWRTVAQHGIDQVHRDARCHYAERFSWRETTRGQLTLFRRILGRTGTCDGATASPSADAVARSVYEDGE